MIIDLHTNTRPASTCSIMPPEELVQRAKEIGLDGVCLTEHNKVHDPAVIQDLSDRNNTRPASTCSIMPPEELVQRAKEIGLDGVCLTEHNKVHDPAVIQDL